MHGLYPNDASWIDTAGRLLILAFFAIVWLRNLSSHHTEDHIKRLTFFKTPMPRAAFSSSWRTSSAKRLLSHTVGLDGAGSPARSAPKVSRSMVGPVVGRKRTQPWIRPSRLRCKR